MCELHQLLREFSETNPNVTAFCIASLASFVGETVTYPLDMIKTRQQIYGELQTGNKVPSSFRIVVDVVKHEGVLAMFRGLSPALFRHLFYTGLRMPLYEMIRSGSIDFRSSQFADEEMWGPDGPESVEGITEHQHFGIFNAALAGIVSGAVAQFICNPTDLLKVQLQSNKRTSVAHKPSISTFQMARKILNQRGLIGLWRGALPNTQRAALVNMGEMTTYDTAKHFLIDHFNFHDGPFLQFCSSSLSGFVSSCLGTPTDLIKTRMMRPLPKQLTLSKNLSPEETKRLIEQMQYKGMLDCAAKIVRAEGFFALYKGFFLIWARMAPWSLTFWLSYEQMRQFCGLKAF